MKMYLGERKVITSRKVKQISIPTAIFSEVEGTPKVKIFYDTETKEMTIKFV